MGPLQVALAAVGGAGAAVEHADPVAPVILGLVLVLIAAKVGGDLAIRIGQPAVLGELVAGVLIGNLSLAGFGGFEHLETDASLDLLARLGVVILLLEVGLESTVPEMMRVGLPSLLVACLGVVTPFALGWGVGAIFLPGASRAPAQSAGCVHCTTCLSFTLIVTVFPLTMMCSVNHSPSLAMLPTTSVPMSCTWYRLPDLIGSVWELFTCTSNPLAGKPFSWYSV